MKRTSTDTIRREGRVVHRRTPLLTDAHMHYCPGCNHATVHRLVAEVLDDMGLQADAIGIGSVGCSVFIYNYIDIDWIQASHGRAPAVATAVKRLNPSRLVFTYQGDGDLAAIGTAETIHACNRGENIAIIYVNNSIYGMTGGQMAPTTPLGMRTSTTPQGRDARLHGYPLDICRLLRRLPGVGFLARRRVDTPRHIRAAKQAIREAFECSLAGRGTAVVEIMAECLTNKF